MYTEKTIAAACIYLAITGYNCIPLKDALPVLLTGSGADQTSFMNCVHTLKALYPDFDHLFHLCVCFSDLCGGFQLLFLPVSVIPSLFLRAKAIPSLLPTNTTTQAILNKHLHLLLSQRHLALQLR